MNIKIITDSTCDLPQSILKEYGIDTVTMYIILDDKSYREGIEITQKQVVDWSNKKKKPPKTAAPSLDDFIEAFKPYAEKKQEIIFIGTSSETTAACQTAKVAADTFEGSRIEIIDGRSLTSGTGCLVYAAARMAKDGKKAEEIKDAVKTMIPKISVSFMPEKLEFLKRGGRCSSVQSFAANILNLKMEIASKDGFLVVNNRYKGSLIKAVEKYVEHRLDNLDEIDPKMIFIGSTVDDAGIIPLLIDIVERKQYFEKIHVIKASCIVTAHSGPNTYSITYVKK